MRKIEAKDINVAVDSVYFAIAASFAAKEDIRYYINGVYVEPAPDQGVLIIGTDGHRLVVMHDRDGICKQPVIISINPRKQVLNACKEPSEGFLSKVVLTTDNSLFIGPCSIPDSEGALIESIFRHPDNPIIDGKYPDWRRVVPDEEKLMPGLCGSFNGAYLEDFCKLTKLADQRFQAITFFHYGEKPEHNSTVIRMPQNKDFIGVLMPMRVDAIKAIPEWLKAA